MSFMEKINKNGIHDEHDMLNSKNYITSRDINIFAIGYVSGTTLTILKICGLWCLKKRCCRRKRIGPIELNVRNVRNHPDYETSCQESFTS